MPNKIDFELSSIDNLKATVLMYCAAAPVAMVTPHIFIPTHTATIAIGYIKYGSLSTMTFRTDLARTDVDVF